MFVIERLIDLAARQPASTASSCGAAISSRRRRMPYANPLGMIYDSGDYRHAHGPRAGAGRLDGIRRAPSAKRAGAAGCAASGSPTTSRSPAARRANAPRSLCSPEGRVDVAIGTLSSGQGHETSFAQMRRRMARRASSSRSRLDPGRHRHRADRRRLAFRPLDADGRRRDGQGVADQIVGRAAASPPGCWRPIAADVAFAEGRFSVKGTDRSIGLFEVAARPRERHDSPEDLRGPLDADGDETIRMPSFPYGCAVCEVEVDPETGMVEIVRYTAGRRRRPRDQSDDPARPDARRHRPGRGQALWEHCALRSAERPAPGRHVHGLRACRAPTCCRRSPPRSARCRRRRNPLGLRGGGEGGTTPALGVVVNAVVDALAD